MLIVGSVGWHLRGAPGAPEEGDPVDGLSVLSRDPSTGLLALLAQRVRVDAPGFLCVNDRRDRVYVASDLADGEAVALSLSPSGELEVLGAQPTGGASPCHVALAADGRLLLTANYAGGSFAVHDVEADGSLSAPALVVQHAGHGSDPDRQAVPHVHMTRPSPDGRWVVAVDLGTDQLVTYEITADGADRQGVPVVADRPTASVQLPAGSGARHVVFGRGDRAYVANELASTISVLGFDPGSGHFDWRADRSTVLSDAPPASGGPSAVIVSEDLAFVLVANRFRNTVAVFDVTEPEMRPVGEFGCGGVMPRDMVLADGRLYVTNAGSEQVAVLEWDAGTGTVGEVVQTVDVPAASCLIATVLPGAAAR